MASSMIRGILVFGFSALVLLAHGGEAFVTKQPVSTSSKVGTDLPKVTHLPIYDMLSKGKEQHSSSSLLMATEDNSKGGGLPFWLDPGTRGGAVFLSLVLFIIPLVGYSVATNMFGVDEVDAGKYIGVGFTAVATLLWVSTYIFRVATKDMTYAKQLKDYENAVIQKRLEELDEDEIQALQEEIERDEF
ncbi:unnamed protein product [Pseudo-nitzschia multistriata]|uniref:Uncharacterized protein n=1 Tax=Pseudo-nitzschia multistriata TaxID=183589 RepID=A0A448ZBB8_9STRA|nr:unnamed protein product [Pseudo-nitzschia multistriata]